MLNKNKWFGISPNSCEIAWEKNNKITRNNSVIPFHLQIAW